MLSNTNDNDSSTTSTNRFQRVRQGTWRWVHENKPLAAVLGLVAIAIVGSALFSTPQPLPPTTPAMTANQAVTNGFMDFEQLSTANLKAMEPGLNKLLGTVNNHGDAIVTNASNIKKVDAKVDQVDGRVKKIETTPPPKFPMDKYEEDFKRRFEKLIDEKLKKFELNVSEKVSQHDAKTDSAFAQVLKQLSVISTAQAEPAQKQQPAANASAQPASTNPQVQARVQEYLKHCGESEDMKSVWSWAGTASDTAFRRHLKSCDDWAASKHAFVARNEQRYGTGSYQEARNRPARYAGDRMLDSLGPHGRVLHKIRSINDLPPNVRRCIVNTVGARGVPGVAVSQKCMREHWR